MVDDGIGAATQRAIERRDAKVRRATAVASLHHAVEAAWTVAMLADRLVVSEVPELLEEEPVTARLVAVLSGFAGLRDSDEWLALVAEARRVAPQVFDDGGEG